MGRVKRRGITKKRSIKKVFYALLIAFAIVSFWRGVWGIMDEFLFPNNFILSSIVSVAIGILILYFTKNLLRKLI